jgi:hypothetical protein
VGGCSFSLKKYENYFQTVGPAASSAEVMAFRVMHYIRVRIFFTLWGLWVSKDAEFYVDFKNINLFW